MFEIKIPSADESKNNDNSKFPLGRNSPSKNTGNQGIFKKEEEKQENIVNNQEMPEEKKKNRTLQFYKFLLYSLKTEMKINEFFYLIKISSVYEISAFLFTILLLLTGEFGYSFLFLGLLHFIRGCVGLHLLEKLPKSYELIENFTAKEEELQTKIFNDIVRDNFKNLVFTTLEKQKKFLILYFVLNFLNYILDLIAFFISLSLMGQVQDLIDIANCSNCTYNNSTNNTLNNNSIIVDLDFYNLGDPHDTAKVLVYITILLISMFYLGKLTLLS